MDLALALVEEDHGRELALAVARQLVLFLKRPGGQSQFSAQLSAQLAERQPLRELQAWIIEHPQRRPRCPALARARRHEPAQLRARLHARGRRDARALRRAARASRRRGAGSRRTAARRRRRSPRRAASAAPRRCAARSCARCASAPRDYRSRFRLRSRARTERRRSHEASRSGSCCSTTPRSSTSRAPGRCSRWPRARQQGDRVVTIAESARPVRCAKGLRVLPDHGFADAPGARRRAGARRPGHAPRGRQPGADRLAAQDRRRAAAG